MNRCLGCMEEKDESLSVCPHCGYVEGTAPKEKYHLPPGIILNNKYLVGKVIGYGGFGITYLGWDLFLARKVAVKEYLPVNLATRTPGKANVAVLTNESGKRFENGQQRFMKEARRLARFNNVESIVDIHDVFLANNTSYIVMEYLDGDTIGDLLRQNGVMPFESARLIMTEILKTLSVVHKEDIIHRDISPDNIFITRDNKIKLLDFGAARYSTGITQSEKLSVILKPGYAPPEQYQTNGNQGPWSDVYATAATIYKMITGITVDESIKRVAEDNLKSPKELGVSIPDGANTAIMNALNVRVERRTPTADIFMNELSSDKVARVADDTKKKSKKDKKNTDKEQKTRKGAKAVPFIIAAVVAVLVLALGISCGLALDDKAVNDLDTDLAIEYALVTDVNAEQTYQELKFEESTAFGQIQFPNTQMEKRMFEGIDNNVTHIYFKVKANDEDTAFAVKNNGVEIKAEDGIYKIPVGDSFAEIEIVSTNKMPILSFWSKTSTYPVTFTKNTFAKLTGLTYTVDGTDIDIGFDPSMVEYSVGTVYVGQTAVVTPIYDTEKYKVEISNGGKVPTSQSGVVKVEVKVSGANEEDKTIMENTYTIVVDVKEVPKEEESEPGKELEPVLNMPKSTPESNSEPTSNFEKRESVPVAVEQTYTVPNLKWYDVSDGEKVSSATAINRLGISNLSKNINIIIKWTENYNYAGEVISTSPSAGTKMKKGETLTITIGYKQVPETITVPDITGYKYNSSYVERKIDEMEEFGVYVYFNYSNLKNDDRVGIIYSTSPKVGEKLQKGEIFTIYYYGYE